MTVSLTTLQMQAHETWQKTDSTEYQCLHKRRRQPPESNCALPVGLKLLVGEEVRINFVDADEGIALKSETL